MKSFKEIALEENRKNSNLHIVEGEELKKLQQLLLDIYLDIQSFCINHGITCMLLGGSALGSVRHKGFIPWDDDMDIGMTRSDFEKFKILFKDNLGKKYILNCPNYEGVPTNRFPKVLKKGTKFVESGDIDDDRACVKIDIFILENIPNCYLLRLIKGLCCTFLMYAGGHVLSYEQKKYRKEKLGKREIIGKLFSFISSKKWFDLFDKTCRCNNENSRLMGFPSGRKHYFGEILNRGVFLPVSEGVFEGYKIFLPCNVSCYLNNLYGNYMTIPSEDKREKHYVEKIQL